MKKFPPVAPKHSTQTQHNLASISSSQSSSRERSNKTKLCWESAALSRQSTSRGGDSPIRGPGPQFPSKRPSGPMPEYLITTEQDFIFKAAREIFSADFLIVAAGAGFSADSGLPVYKDIADVAAYHRMGVTYADLCDPVWQRKDAEIFFGFWGSCFNGKLHVK